MRGFKVELSNGLLLSEEEVKIKLAEECKQMAIENLSPWIALTTYCKNCNLKIVALLLQFDEQTIFLPRNSRVYFYSKKIEAFIGPANEQMQYYGVGATESRNDEVEITWYDGINSTIEKRKVKPEQGCFFINR